jgi:tellurite resistance protein
MFLRGLIAVARTDGAINLEEMASLRAIAADLGLVMPDEEDLLVAGEVAPHALAAAIGSAGGPFRASGSQPDEIGRAFVEAAQRLSRADGELTPGEVAILSRFAAALGEGNR